MMSISLMIVMHKSCEFQTVVSEISTVALMFLMTVTSAVFLMTDCHDDYWMSVIALMSVMI
jgi:hypothetical protein